MDVVGSVAADPLELPRRGEEEERENHGESSDGEASIRGSARTSLGDGDGGGPVHFHWGARSLYRRSPRV